MIPRITLAAAILTAATTTVVVAQQSAPVEVQNAWARATAPRAPTGAVYMTLTAATDDRLTGASSPRAAKAEVHRTQMDGSIMRMTPVPDGLDLPAGKHVTLQPGGYHLMLEGLKTGLGQGQTVPIHLTFQKAPALDIMVTVEPIGATGAPAAMPGMTMGK